MIASEIFTPMGSTTASISKGPISLSAKSPRLSEIRKKERNFKKGGEKGGKINEKMLKCNFCPKALAWREFAYIENTM